KQGKQREQRNRTPASLFSPLPPVQCLEGDEPVRNAVTGCAGGGRRDPPLRFCVWSQTAQERVTLRRAGIATRATLCSEDGRAGGRKARTQRLKRTDATLSPRERVGSGARNPAWSESATKHSARRSRGEGPP